MVTSTMVTNTICCDFVRRVVHSPANKIECIFELKFSSIWKIYDFNFHSLFTVHCIRFDLVLIIWNFHSMKSNWIFFNCCFFCCRFILFLLFSQRIYWIVNVQNFIEHTSTVYVQFDEETVKKIRLKIKEKCDESKMRGTEKKNFSNYAFIYRFPGKATSYLSKKKMKLFRLFGRLIFSWTSNVLCNSVFCSFSLCQCLRLIARNFITFYFMCSSKWDCFKRCAIFYLGAFIFSIFLLFTNRVFSSCGRCASIVPNDFFFFAKCFNFTMRLCKLDFFQTWARRETKNLYVVERWWRDVIVAISRRQTERIFYFCFYLVFVNVCLCRGWC